MLSQTSINNKRIAKNTIYLYLRMLVAMALGVYTSRLVLQALGETDFGIYNVVGGIVVFLNFFNGTLVASIQRFINMALGMRSLNYTKDVYHASLKIHFTLSLIIVLLAETIGLWIVNTILTVPPERMYAANVIYQFSILTIFFSINQSPLQAMVIAQEKMQYYAAISIWEIVAKFAVAIFLLHATYDTLILYGILLSVIGLINYFLYYNVCRWKFEECKGRHTIGDKSIYKSMLGFSGWATIGCMAGVFSNQGVNILLNVYAGPTVNAARGLAMTLNNYVYSFVNNFTVAFSPQLIKLYASKENEQLCSLLTNSVKYSVFLFSVFALPLLFETEFVLNLWLTEVPAFTVIFCQIVISGSFISCAERPMATVCNAIGCVKQVNLSVGLFYLFAFGLSWLTLYCTGNVINPFLIHIGATCIGVFMFLHYIHKYINISIKYFFTSIFIRPVITLSIPIMLLTFIHYSLSIGLFRLGVTVSVSTISIMCCIYTIGLSKSEKRMIVNLIMSKICSTK